MSDCSREPCRQRRTISDLVTLPSPLTERRIRALSAVDIVRSHHQTLVPTSTVVVEHHCIERNGDVFTYASLPSLRAKAEQEF